MDCRHDVKKWLLLLLLSVEAASHSLQYIITATTSRIHFPEYTVVGLVDGEQFVYYDSNISKMIPKTEWMKKNEGEKYWNRETQKQEGAQEIFRANLDILMKRFNQTDGVHTLQRRSGCELGENGTVTGYFQFGYDGEDFLILDMRTLSWTAAHQKAVSTKLKWEPAGDPNFRKHYLDNDCVDYLRKYVEYGRSTLERKVSPEVSLIQKDSSSPVVCHATGFFPKAVMISWQKNGEDLHEDVELRETLPNQDGTFQRRSVLTVSPEELNKHNYTCIIQHSSLEKEVVLHVSERRVLKDEGSVIIIFSTVVAALLIVIIVCVGLLICKKKKQNKSGKKGRTQKSSLGTPTPFLREPRHPSAPDDQRSTC
ncbi:class I histocompatibility antigen, F10 alpha chain-like [Colossoma macropomum]|uniref:class I histocompatibility antigen, F10 alpha chain-like n=1 Tax=Colossoma macropomum TaxID=42526 RepID=UPI0018640B14|nr:class I histocompatibility antigen, F10 alpha chain-like [Colossoma macropomum]